MKNRTTPKWKRQEKEFILKCKQLQKYEKSLQADLEAHVRHFVEKKRQRIRISLGLGPQDRTADGNSG